MADGNETSWDAAAAAEALAAPLRAWAWTGFLRGFSGTRKEVLPLGSMRLPSKAFTEVAMAEIEGASGEEYEARHRYILEVEEALRRKQNEFIRLHYRNTVWGHAADFALGLTMAGLMIGLICRVGPYSPVTPILMGLIALKGAFLHCSVKRAIRIADRAFDVRNEDVLLPWRSRGQGAGRGASPSATT